MKNFRIVIFLIGITLIFSCKKETVTPKVIYEDNSKAVKNNQVKIDSTQIEIADLPIAMSGTKYLIHPIGDYRIVSGKSKYSYGNSTAEQGSFTVSNNIDFEITGFLTNLKFQKIGSDSIVNLTDKKILIQSATYLKKISDKIKKQILVYTLVDMDTNKDGKLNSNDIKSLYISDISGKTFTKLSNDFQELIDWNLLDISNSLYFRTIEDTNKNGEFDKNDVLHYHFIDLSNNKWLVQNYKPI